MQHRTNVWGSLSGACYLKINQNQLTLEAAIMELTLWVEQRGSGEVAENARGALEAINRDEEFVKIALAVLKTPE